MRLEDLNALYAEAAARELRRCCGSSRWAALMAAARPFANAEALAVVADVIWGSLDPADWLEAFASHPRIGSGGAGGSGGWSDREQAGVADAADDIRSRLADANRDYEARFGYIFIVCATGRSAGEILGLLEARLQNDADREIGLAANEQRKITRQRLMKLLDASEAEDASPHG